MREPRDDAACQKPGGEFAEDRVAVAALPAGGERPVCSIPPHVAQQLLRLDSGLVMSP